jgi:hypothetical protein
MIEIPDKLADDGGTCPLCGVYLRRGELGPNDAPIITSALSSLPSTHILAYGARRHDVAYHMGTSWGTRKQADDLMLEKNKAYIKSLNLGWIKTLFYTTMNYRNWLAVRMFGDKFFNHKGCKQ